MNIITWLRTPIATLIVLCAALLAQLPHAADVFRLLVNGNGLWAVLHGYAYAIALELAVLLFVVQRRNAESYVFAGVSVLVNLSYYALHGTDLFSVAAAPAWLVSIALPAAIARYSHLLVDDTPTPPVTVAPAAPIAVRVAAHADAAPDVAPDVALDDALSMYAADAVADLLQPDAKTRALQLLSEGYSATDVAREVGAKPATVRSWQRRATAQRNGGAA